ncbi:prephenate dehydrogenase [Halothiobacillus neapolitanus]|uniref:prephenate dehydrogenase n=1 Tax=Halothiobacillus neapolitanus (strain ATCC 23641 / DSM 15147 / CIP 104769 / NCIMB 8539 / c2) TaxID=555778 RepID=D0L0E5_HALNC|nr:prephenate dehydrogenase/arogenate dehydrogenase family protein [Halothiobacillus neapolitanus]ACX96168.1 Prephenate dehydrogenase [Halothiobacillus neapolitanus c2]TDN66478.1 prephenate dehydrogenase [Halothiobacillus neapolitanus]
MINRLALIGLGLIGGSLSLALKERGLVGEVVGYSRQLQTRLRARELGLIDRPVDSAAEAVRGADVVFIATPVQAMASVFAEIGPELDPGALITDGGSVKGNVVAAAKLSLSPAQWGQFVPGHPIAGTERSGPDAAFATLFVDHRVILTPISENAPEMVTRAVDLWQSVGAIVEQMDVQHHDHVLAATSHLPHLAAFGLVSALSRLEERYEVFRYAAGGFRDFSRIASSDPQMWRDICVANRDELLPMLDHYLVELHRLRQLIEASDSAGVEKLFADAKAVRDALYRPATSQS